MDAFLAATLGKETAGPSSPAGRLTHSGRAGPLRPSDPAIRTGSPLPVKRHRRISIKGFERLPESPCLQSLQFCAPIAVPLPCSVFIVPVCVPYTLSMFLSWSLWFPHLSALSWYMSCLLFSLLSLDLHWPVWCL